MSRGRFVLKALFALVMVGMLLSAVMGILGLGWWRGRRIAQWTPGETQEMVPHLRGLYGPSLLLHGPRFGLFSFLCGAGLLKVALILLLLVFVGRIWRTGCGPMGRGWHGHWHGPWCWHHGPMRHWEKGVSFKAKVGSSAAKGDDPAGDADED